MNQHASNQSLLNLLRRGRSARQRLGRLSLRNRTDQRRQLMLECFEPRIVLAGIPELIDLNSAGSSSPADFTQVGDFVYFTADDGENGRELWRTDGSVSGTTLVLDIQPGSESSNPRDLVEFNGSLVFAANDGTSGEELWISDGTASGTVLLNDIHTGEGYQYPYGDGPLQSFPREMVPFGGSLVFSAEDDTSGSELWLTDGTSSGTATLADVATGTYDNNYGTYPSSSNPRDLTVVNGTLFFTADDGSTGRELWKTDGTQAGTVLVKDLYEGDYPYYYDGNYYGVYPNSGSPARLTASGGLLFFTATDGVDGVELWRSDGTESGTFQLNDIQPGGGDAFYGDDNSLTDVDGTLFFAAENDTTGKELWVSDGTQDGTELVRDIRAGSVGSITNGYFTSFQGELYFAADDGSVGTELWKSDGTEDGTVLVANIDGTNSASFPRYMEEVEGTLFFSAFTSGTGRELWESDGTTNGTMMVEEILSGASSSSPQELFAMDRTLLFSADNGTAGRELYAVSAIGDSLTASLAVYVDGQQVALPANIGVDSGGTAISQVRTLGGTNGTLEIGPIGDEPLQAITLGDFFETWRTNAGQAGNNADATFTDTTLLGNDVGGDNTIHMFVNGELENIL